jgi:hypothetical protein
MVSLRRLAVLLVLGAFAGSFTEAQSSSSDAAPQAAPQPAQQAPTTSAPLTVQARIRARREQRRAAAIHDVYTHLYEAYFGGGYLRFHPGPNLQRNNEYAWNVGVSRYYSERFGVTVDGRGYYGPAFLGTTNNGSSFLSDPKVSQYTAMIGPTYRFLLNPHYSVSGRVLGGVAIGNFSGDLGSFSPGDVGLYSNSTSPAINGSVAFEYNVSPGLGLRLAPEFLYTHFGSENQNSLGYTAGLVYRWGKQ